MIEEGLREKLAHDPDISATGVAGRVSPQLAAQVDVLPYITYARGGSAHQHTLTGPIKLCRAVVSLHCWAATQLAAEQLADLVRRKIDGFKGLWDKQRVQAVHVLDERHNLEPSPDSDQQRSYGVELDIAVWFEEPIPAYAPLG